MGGLTMYFIEGRYGMQVLSLPGLAPRDVPERAVVALGFFDGVHTAHAAVLGAAGELARRLALPLLVYTFTSCDPPKRGPLLSEDAERAAHFSRLGAECAVFAPFSSVAHLSPREFIDDTLLGELRAAAAVVGEDFRFGRGAAGDAALLRSAFSEVGGECRVIAPLLDGGAPISSSRIRAMLAAGDVSGAARLLGRPYSLTLPVLRGKSLGHTLGFPTANQCPGKGRAIPRFGVYVTEVTLPDGGRCFGITDVGTRPTVSGSEVRIETHLLGFSGDLYGKSLTVAFLHRLRDERKFSSLSELTAGIAEDSKEAEAWILANGRS